jgi:hypothetical protein
MFFSYFWLADLFDIICFFYYFLVMTNVKPLKVGVDTVIVAAQQIGDVSDGMICLKLKHGDVLCLLSDGPNGWQEILDPAQDADPKDYKDFKIIAAKLEKNNDISLVEELNENVNVSSALARWVSVTNKETLKRVAPEKYETLSQEKNQVIAKVNRGFDEAVSEALEKLSSPKKARSKPSKVNMVDIS